MAKPSEKTNKPDAPAAPTDPKTPADPADPAALAAAEAEAAETQTAALTSALRSAKSSLRGARADTLVPHPVQPTGRKPDADMIASVRDVGVLSPIVVAKDGKTILSGHKRWQAAKLAGLETVPVVERSIEPNSAEAAAYVVAANVGNAPMSRGDRRTAIADLLARGYKSGAIARTIAAEKGTVDAIVSAMTRLPDDLKARYLAGEISDGDAKKWASWAGKDPVGAAVKAREAVEAVEDIPANVADREKQIADTLAPEIPPEIASAPGKTGRAVSAKVRSGADMDAAILALVKVQSFEAANVLAWGRGHGTDVDGENLLAWCGDHVDRLKAVNAARLAE